MGPGEALAIYKSLKLKDHNAMTYYKKDASRMFLNNLGLQGP
jgi:hypothetical protein